MREHQFKFMGPYKSRKLKAIRYCDIYCITDVKTFEDKKYIDIKPDEPLTFYRNTLR